MASDRLRDRITFQVSTAVEQGRRSPEWTDRFTVAAQLIPLRGGETVRTSRLAGVQPYLARVRISAQAREITSAWRAVNARRTAQAFNIRSVADDLDKQGRATGYLAIVMDDGRADGR